MYKRQSEEEARRLADLDHLTGCHNRRSFTTALGDLLNDLERREQALAAYTAGAAYAGFAEGRFGALAEGERADFVILSADPLMSNAAEMREIEVLETWIAGQRVYDVELETQ